MQRLHVERLLVGTYGDGCAVAVRLGFGVLSPPGVEAEASANHVQQPDRGTLQVEAGMAPIPYQPAPAPSCPPRGDGVEGSRRSREVARSTSRPTATAVAWRLMRCGHRWPCTRARDGWFPPRLLPWRSVARRDRRRQRRSGSGRRAGGAAPGSRVPCSPEVRSPWVQRR